MAKKNPGGRPKEFREDLHSFVLRLPTTLFEELRARATELGVSANDLVLIATADWLARPAVSTSHLQAILANWKRHRPG